MKPLEVNVEDSNIRIKNKFTAKTENSLRGQKSQGHIITPVSVDEEAPCHEWREEIKNKSCNIYQQEKQPPPLKNIYIYIPPLLSLGGKNKFASQCYSRKNEGNKHLVEESWGHSDMNLCVSSRLRILFHASVTNGDRFSTWRDVCTTPMATAGDTGGRRESGRGSWQLTLDGW